MVNTLKKSSPSARALLTVGTAALISLGGMQAATAAGADTKLTRETSPLNPEADSQFSIDEIKGVEKYFKKLAKGAKADGDSPEKHVYSLLGPARQAVLTRWEKEDKYSDNMRFDLIVALNQMVRRDDIYVPEIWEGRTLSENLLEGYRNFDKLGAVDQARLNRRLFAETWPGLIAEPVKPNFVERPERLLEKVLPGDRFLGSGDLQKGFTVPLLGAVWQPNFLLFGNVRSRAQAFDPGTAGGTDFVEWANSINLNVNLALTPTERMVVTFTPLHRGQSATGYISEDVGDREEGSEEFVNGDPQTFFFEGDLGELFPNLDKNDSAGLDFGFAVGRQPIQYQRGFMVDDELDSVGITKNNLAVLGASNLQITGLYAWNEIDRSSGVEDNDANLFGLFTAWDYPKNSIALDYMFVSSDVRYNPAVDGIAASTGDLTDADMAMAASGETGIDPNAEGFGGDSHHIGLTSVQRIGLYGTSLSLNASLADEETRAVSEGFLVFGDVNYTLPHGKDLIYGTGFVAIDEYSAVRRPLALGPLAPAGILFEGPGIGLAGSALSTTATDVAGGSIGYQKFYNDNRTQFISEIGLRVDTADDADSAGDSFGIGFRVQHAIGQHWIVRGDAAVASIDADESDERVVAGAEIRYQF